MEILTNNELEGINGGGGLSLGLVLGIGAAVALIAGFLDGFTRPLTCK